MLKAVFSPGPSYADPGVRKFAGWVRILDLYKEGLEECGYDVVIPEVDPHLIDQSSTVSKILSYDIVASRQLPWDADLFLGPPGYSITQMTHIGLPAKKFLYVWNNSDDWRDQQLIEEYKNFGQPYDLSPTWRWINRTALEMCDHVIACSPWVKKTHARIVSEKKISIAFWGVDSRRFYPPEVEPEGFRVLFVGGDPIRKGLIYLVEALREMENYELWIAGCSPLVDANPNFVKQFGMVPHVDMLRIYQQCHVLVCPTLEDGIALCVQEAMACGLIPVTSPETAEVFTSGVEGFEVDYRDVDTIRNRIQVLQGDINFRKKMSLAARKKAESQTWEKTKEQFKDIIRRECG